MFFVEKIFPRKLLVVFFVLVGIQGAVHGQTDALGGLSPLYLEEGQLKTLYLTDFPEIDWQVRYTTNLGSFDVNLRNDVAPATVRNFLSYVVSGAYNQGFLHRSVPGFVIQGGGYSLTGTGESYSVSSSSKNGTVPGEFQLPNLRGTMAMALVEGDPDSGSNQWFINVRDNQDLDDPANGPFTVFGEILPPGMEVVDSINSLTRVNFGSPFNEVPMLKYTQGEPVVFDDFVSIPTVMLLNAPQLLRVTPPGFIQATLTGDRLELEMLPGVSGEAEITLGFTSDGVWVEESFRIISGEQALLVFGYLQQTEPNRYQSPSYGELEFAEDGANKSEAFSHSLQTILFAENSLVQSPYYGRLTPNPWDIENWVVSEFFGLVHFGITGDDYGGWVSSERFGWMKFENAGENTYLWVPMMNSWMSVNADGSFYSFEWRQLTPEGLNRYQSSVFGGLTTGDFGGWVSSDRFGWMWANGDGTWFWSETRQEWLGVTSDGGIWSTAESRFLN